MKKNLLSTVAMFGVAAAVAWSGPLAADDFDGRGPDFGRHDNDFGRHDNDFGRHDNNDHHDDNDHHGNSQDEPRTATPIKHIVVIFNENISFDHYFATYPNAANPAGEPAFTPAAGTPSVNGLSGTLLTANPNFTNTANGTGAANPFRLDRTQAATADQNHAYMPEQQAYNNGAADLFPKFTGKGTAGGAGTRQLDAGRAAVPGSG